MAPFLALPPPLPVYNYYHPLTLSHLSPSSSTEDRHPCSSKRRGLEIGGHRPLGNWTQLLNTAHGLLFRSRIRARKINNLHSHNYNTLHKSPVQIFRVCEAALPSKKKAVFFKSSQRPRTRVLCKRQSDTHNEVR